MQNVFKRYEEKYLITQQQSAALQKVLALYMMPDQYGEYVVQNIYYDTDNWDVIRASIERPVYKEKMRLRCYNRQEATPFDIFLELKKKFKGIVYKRRMLLMEEPSGKKVREIVAAQKNQISSEIDFYLRQNPVWERVHISYRRKALAGIKEPHLRITFDTDMYYRLDRLNFSSPLDGRVILPLGEVVMEIKTPMGIPLWLARALSENHIYPRSFSKYGVCFTSHICCKELMKGSA